MKSPILQMTHSDYLAHPAYGASDIVKMSRSFAFWKRKKEHPDPPGRPLVVGNATHLLLQAELSGLKLLAQGVKVYEEGSSLTKGFKEFQKQNPSLYCVDAEEHALCLRMVKALLDEPEVMRYLKDAYPEATVIANYPGTKIQCKVRPDYLHEALGVSINLKTAADASESGFIYSARDYGYDWQSALYCDILTDQLGKPFDEVHILVEKGDTDEECQVNIFSFGDDTLAWARTHMRELINQIPEHEKSGKWPKKQAYLQTIDLPLHMRRLTTK